MKPPRVHTVDFETLPIGKRPDSYPPKPVGVAIREAGKRKSEYLAWGHPEGGNNCSLAQAKARLKKLWASGIPIVFHNAKFDVDVAEVHLGLPALPWDLMHDTMYLLFLHDPHAKSFGLKAGAEAVLGQPPEERDELYEWIMKNAKTIKAKHGYRVIKSTAGGAIAYAPVKLVGRYACGDTDRTYDLFRALWPSIASQGMLEAYDRERELMPILLANERTGMRVDVKRLKTDIAVFKLALEDADKWLRRRLNDKGLNINSDADFAAALDKSGVVLEDAWTLTKAGRRSVSKKNLKPDMFQDQQVASVFGYRNRLMTCLGMFMEPWLEEAERFNGYIATNWNQVRQVGSGSGGNGARTGRPSTREPNFLNPSKNWYDKGDGYTHPARNKNLPELPLVRRYILPDRGGLFLHRDYSQQELRILAHFEDGVLLDAYTENCRMDVHDFVKGLILEIAHMDMQRRAVKVINFQTIYGGGKPAISSELEISFEEAGEFIAAHRRALPGVAELKKTIKAIVSGGDQVVTWGNRRYDPEPPSYSKKFGRHMTYEYKLLNYLIQGSAADITKQAVIDFHNAGTTGRFLVTVYDEINVSAPKGDHRDVMAVLRDCMERQELDVPLLTDGKSGTSWAELKAYQEGPSDYE